MAGSRPSTPSHQAAGEAWKSGARPGMKRTENLALLEGAVVKPAMEPILIAGDVLLHRHVDVGLEDRDAWHVRKGSFHESLDVLFIGGLVAICGGCDRAVNEAVERLRLIAHRVEDRILAVIAPDEEVLGIVEPPRKHVGVERQYLLVEFGAPSRARDLVDRAFDADLSEAFLGQYADRLVDPGEAEIEGERGFETVGVAG